MKQDAMLDDFIERYAMDRIFLQRGESAKRKAAESQRPQVQSMTVTALPPQRKQL